LFPRVARVVVARSEVFEHFEEISRLILVVVDPN
jgi:hypothetical protein